MGKFILSTRQGQYEFGFHAATGDRIAVSPPYFTKSSARHAIIETRRLAGNMHLYRKKEIEGQYYFELADESDRTLLTSVRFWSEESRDYAITMLKRAAETADLFETI